MTGLVPQQGSNRVAYEARSGGPPPASRGRYGGFATLTVGALGIVYGDIGTSPLYAMDQLSIGRAGGTPTPAEVLGGVSLVVWTITLIVAIKYAIFVLRAQNDGEGGVFALYGLLAEPKGRITTILLWSLMLGAGFLFSDGMLAPAISVFVGRGRTSCRHASVGKIQSCLSPLDCWRLSVRSPVQGHVGHWDSFRFYSLGLVHRYRRPRRRFCKLKITLKF